MQTTPAHRIGRLFLLASALLSGQSALAEVQGNESFHAPSGYGCSAHQIAVDSGRSPETHSCYFDPRWMETHGRKTTESIAAFIRQEFSTFCTEVEILSDQEVQDRQHGGLMLRRIGVRCS